jgi:hypothetical protein
MDKPNLIKILKCIDPAMLDYQDKNKAVNGNDR